MLNLPPNLPNTTIPAREEIERLNGDPIHKDIKQGLLTKGAYRLGRGTHVRRGSKWS